MTSRHTPQIRLFAIFVLLGVQCACTRGPETSPSRSIEDFFLEFTDEWVREDPNLAVRAQYFEGEEQDHLSRQLTPVTREWRLDRISRAKEGLQKLASFDRDAMTASQRNSRDIMHWQLENIVDSEPFLDYNFPLQQMNGTNVRLPNRLAVLHPVRTERDAENYVARLGQVDERMFEATAESERLAASGVLPPRFILDATIAQMELFIRPVPANNPLVTALAKKMEAVEEIEAGRRQELISEAGAIVESEVYPAWQAAIAALESQRQEATDDAGLWRFEGGDALYAQRLQTYTTTDLTAEEIHAIGLREVARIEAEMDVLFRELGYTEGSIADREEKLNLELRYPNSDEGRTRIMEDIQDILADTLERSNSSFDIQPETPVIAQPYPEFRWASSPASYSAPPPDRSRPGTFQMPLRPNRLTEFRLRTLVYHETVPGHHFQLALSTENTDLPAFRRIRAFGGISANSEGWALYAERFAAEDGWYEGDPAGLLGQLGSALFRARRLVVDTGLHSLGWTREQAVDFGIEPNEVDRYVVYPGQACSYMIGQLKIVELRERARETLGDPFSNRKYHNVVLGLGVVPLTILEQEVDAYIAAQAAQ